MDVFQQLEAIGAQLIANRAIVVADGERVVVAQMVDDKMVLTADGEALVAKAAPASKPEAKAAKSKPTKAAAAPTPEE